MTNLNFILFLIKSRRLYFKFLILLSGLMFLTAGDLSNPNTIFLENTEETSNANSSFSLPQVGSASREAYLFSLFPSKFKCTLPEGTSDLMCEVCNCIHENGWEPAEGRVAVNRVVYTRVISGHYPKSICGVIRQDRQFSWYNRGMPQKNHVLNTNMQVFRNCIKTSAESEKFKGSWFASNYYNPYLVSPSWASGCRAFKMIVNHRFATGGCYGVRPNTTFIEQNQPQFEEQSAPATSWLEELFYPLFAHAGFSPVDEFLVENKDYKLKTEFSDDVQKYMGKNKNLALIEGDFNGDGQKDFVSLLVKKDQHKMVFFISQGSKFVTQIKPISDSNSIYLSKVSKDKVKKGLPGDKARDLVQLEVFMGPTEPFYVENNKIYKFKGQLSF